MWKGKERFKYPWIDELGSKSKEKKEGRDLFNDFLETHQNLSFRAKISSFIVKERVGFFYFLLGKNLDG